MYLRAFLSFLEVLEQFHPGNKKEEHIETSVKEIK